MNKYKKVFKFEIEESEFEQLKKAMCHWIKEKSNYTLDACVVVYNKLIDIADGKSEYEREYR